MRIAQIAPLFESVAPRLYGGTERVVYYLTEDLVGQGHQVTLFASGDSMTSAELVPCTPRVALRLDPHVRDPIPHQMLLLDKVRERADEFDILHFHVDYLHFPLFRSEATRTVTTLHGRQDLNDHMPFYAHFPEMPLVSISNAQRAPLPRANFVATVYQGCRSVCKSRPSNHAVAILPFRPDRTREATRQRHCDCAGGRPAAEDRSEGRQGGRSLFPRSSRLGWMSPE